MPPGVRFLPSPGVAAEPNYDVNAPVDFWMPAIPDPSRLKQAGWDVVGRLSPGATPSQAQSELSVLATQEAHAERDFEGLGPRLIPLTVEMNRDGSRILLPLLGAAALVLLIACGNVAALLLVRGLQRQQEYAVRSALGIGRLALFRQVSMEGLLLALLGGVSGAALAIGLVRLFKLVGGHAIPRLQAGRRLAVPIFAWGSGLRFLRRFWPVSSLPCEHRDSTRCTYSRARAQTPAQAVRNAAFSGPLPSCKPR